MKPYIDLHMHSNHSSDGQYTPEEIIKKCYENNLKIVALSDHNSTSGVLNAIDNAKLLGIKVIPALEIDCEFKGTHLHVLAYGIDYLDPFFKQLEDKITAEEQLLSIERLSLTQQLGFNITKEEMDKVAYKGIYTGEMFAEILLAREDYLEHPLLAPYRPNGSRSDNPFVNFYWDYYGQDKPCYTPSSNAMSLEMVLEEVHKRNGICVLAHPGNNLKGKFELFDEMIKLGIDGVEAFSNYHNQSTNDYFYKLGIANNLLTTCGSDYHGKTKPSIIIGASGCTIDQSIIEQQLQNRGLL